jgi:predicted anti-sigma-YlaC factor YlaD
MPSCDDFQILIEQRLHGALLDADHPSLDAHLGGCAQCREYEANATDNQRVLVAQGGGEGPVDWARLEAAIRREGALLDWEWALVACGMLVHNLVWLVFFSWKFVRPWALPVLGVEVSACLAFGLRERWALRRRVATLPTEELMGWLRRHAAWRRSSARQVRWATPAGLAVLAFGWALVDRHGRGVDPGLLVRAHLALLICGAFLLAILAWVEGWVLPRARRECSTLKVSP